MDWRILVAYFTLAVVTFTNAQECPWSDWVDVPGSDPPIERRFGGGGTPPCSWEERNATCPAWPEWSVWKDVTTSSTLQSRFRIRGPECSATQIQNSESSCPQNILITVDTSSSVSRKRFNELKNGTTLMLRHADIRPLATHVGICYFGTTAEAIMPLVPFHNHTDVNAIIAASQPLSGRTMVSLGCECLHSEWLSSTRSETHTVCVLVIDGNPSNPPAASTAKELEDTRACIAKIKNTTCNEFVIFAIGNAFTNISEIESWKKLDTPNNYFHTPSFERFREFFEAANAFPMNCPVDGEWSQWGTWTDCSVTCGGGRRVRVRTCTNPMPTEGGSDCNNADGDSDVGVCNPSPCPVNGNWAEWRQWSTCSVTCGGGTRGRSRTCTNPPPTNGGNQCVTTINDGIDNEGCNSQTCIVPPTHGGWGTWSTWTACSVTCGSGRRSRRRGCTRPVPANDGRNCVGNALGEDRCQLDGCDPIIGGDCDNCTLINGIGYKDLDPCWKYLQCYFDADGNVIKAIVRDAAWGNFWNQFHINQDAPGHTHCQYDVCRGQVEGYRYAHPDNCRAFWECGPDGRTYRLDCCDADSKFDGSCVPDQPRICNDACPPITPTSQGPIPCPLRIRAGTDNRVFYNTLDANAEDMSCAETQNFDEALCTCVNLIDEGCVPEFWLDFSDGVIADVSRNRYYIRVENVTVGQDSDGYYGIFDKALVTKLVVPGLASSDPGVKFVVYTRYRRDLTQAVSPNARPAIISDSECLPPLDYSYAAYVDPRTGNRPNVAGWVRSDTGDQRRVNGNEDIGINTYIMEYQGDMSGETLTLDVNGGAADAVSVPGPIGRVRQNGCALHIGYGKPMDNFDYFTGSIYEVRIYRCIPAQY